MARNPALARFSVLLLVLISMLVKTALAADSPEIPPSPAPHSPSDSPSPAPTLAHSPPVDAPSPAPASSPLGSPAPTPHADSPPSPSPASSPSPSPSPAADADDDGVNRTGVKDDDGKPSGGMSAGKKAGIAVGVIAAAGVGVLGCMVYRKRRQNIQRSQYGYAARTELL